jgi:hypothetical protein
MDKIMDVLRENYELKKVSVKKISKETGILESRIYGWLQNRGTPKAEDYLKLSAYFGINPNTPSITGQYTPPTAVQRINELSKDKEILGNSLLAALNRIEATQAVIIARLNELEKQKRK